MSSFRIQIGNISPVRDPTAFPIVKMGNKNPKTSPFPKPPLSLA